MDSTIAAAAPKVAIMTITPDVAAQFTLSPEVCLRQGTFPFFAEEVTGMFIRVKYSNSAASALHSGDNAALASQSALTGESSSQLQSGGGGDHNNYLWTRIRRVVTHYDLQREMNGEKGLDVIGDIDAHLNPHSDDADTEQRWKSKILANPSYKWRGRVFDVYFLCEHPVFGKTIGSDGTPSSSSRLALVDLRILAKNWQPTREDINLYTSDLTHASGNVISGSDEDKKLFAKYASVFLRYPVSPSSPDNLPAILSTNAFAKSEQPRDAPSAANKRGFGQEALNHYLYNPAAVSGVAGTASGTLSSDSKDAFPFPVGSSPENVGAAWTLHVRRYLTSRPLSAIDSKKLVEANTRKLEEAGGGNAVLGYTAAQNDLLYQRYLAQKRAKEEENLLDGASSSAVTATTSSQDIFADAQREAEEMTRREMGIVGDLPSTSQNDDSPRGSQMLQSVNPVVAETEDKFFNYVSNPERNNGLDSLVHLSKRNFKHNSEKTVAMTAFFKLRVEKEGAYHIPAAGSVLWTVDRAERDRMCKVKIDEEHEKWDRETKQKAKDDAAKAKRPLGYADDSRIDALIRDRVQKSNAAAATISSSQHSSTLTPVPAGATIENDDDNDDDLLALARASSSSLRPVGASQTSSTSSPASTRASLLVKSLSGIKRPRSEVSTTTA